MRGRVHQFAKIDDAFDPGFLGSLGKIPRRLQVALGIDLSALHPMDKIIRGGDAMHGFYQLRGVKRIALCRFHFVQPGASLQTGGVTHETTHAITCFKKFWRETPADIAGCAGDKDEFGLCHDDGL